jgi:hypothetical protein
LRHLNRPGALARSPLLTALPHSLRSAAELDAAPATLTPLEQARALRLVLLAALDRLRPAEENVTGGGRESLQHLVLSEAYVLERPNKQIVAAHELSKSGFHRLRREALAALALELAEQESLLAHAAAPIREAP